MLQENKNFQQLLLTKYLRDFLRSLKVPPTIRFYCYDDGINEDNIKSVFSHAHTTITYVDRDIKHDTEIL